MSQPVTIDLMTKNGMKHYEETFVPFRKHLEMLEMNAQLEKEPMSELEWLKKQTSFISSVFTDEEVTPDAIMDGLNSSDYKEKFELVIAQMMGFDPNVIAEAPTA